MAEREDADACSLRHAAEIRDRDAGHAVDRVEAVELERIDDEVKAVRQLALGFGAACFYCAGLFLTACVSPMRNLRESSPSRRSFAARLFDCSIQIVGIFRHVLGEPEGVLAHQSSARLVSRASRASMMDM